MRRAQVQRAVILAREIGVLKQRADKIVNRRRPQSRQRIGRNNVGDELLRLAETRLHLRLLLNSRMLAMRHRHSITCTEFCSGTERISQ